METKAMAFHAAALKFRAQRNEVLASNIANADTPGYKARDIQFSDALQGAQSKRLGLEQTSRMHQQSWSTRNGGAELMYRIPMQPTLDGNTVETDVEQSQFAENTVQYRASLSFLDGAIRSLKYALKGGD